MTNDRLTEVSNSIGTQKQTYTPEERIRFFELFNKEAPKIDESKQPRSQRRKNERIVKRGKL